MNQHTGRALIFVGVLASSAASAAGCFHDAENCVLTRTCNSSAGIGVTPEGCVPSELDGAVDSSCGLFVASRGDDTAAGSKEAPLKTLAAAIAKAPKDGSGRVYACAETFEEALDVPAGLTIYGGLDCANGWGYDGVAKTTLTAKAGAIPLVMRKGERAIHAEDVRVVAAGIDASDETMRGASSIAAVADGARVELVRCALQARGGAPGKEGEPYASAAAPGAEGNAGREACEASIVVPGDQKLNDCGTPDDPSDDSSGGAGGVGLQGGRGAGSPGTPLGVANGGTGEDTALCTPGTAGDNGAPGEPGVGGSGLGQLTTTGFTGVAGADGTRGATAQGGGGGGGAKGGTAARQCTAGSAGGASGGSGGSGGCGGLGGKGGGAGGASIALLSLNATLRFDAVTLETGDGGDGGNGGLGQDGGIPGGGGAGGLTPASATALHAACAGGPGGIGGKGGGGGGGAGGHAVGIAYRGNTPPSDGVTITTGKAGQGGAAEDAEHGGTPGVKADVQEFGP